MLYAPEGKFKWVNSGEESSIALLFQVLGTGFVNHLCFLSDTNSTDGQSSQARHSDLFKALTEISHSLGSLSGVLRSASSILPSLDSSHHALKNELSTGAL